METYGSPSTLYWFAIATALWAIYCHTEGTLVRVERSSLGQDFVSSSRVYGNNFPQRQKKEFGGFQFINVKDDIKRNVKRSEGRNIFLGKYSEQLPLPTRTASRLKRSYRRAQERDSEHTLNLTDEINLEEQYEASDPDGLSIAEPYDYSTFQYSEYHNVFLCQHPPNKFSPEFLRHQQSECEHYDFYYNLNELTTYHLCDYVYEKIYGRSYPSDRIWGMRLENGKEMDLIFDDSFIEICLPLFRRLNKCKEKKYITICEDENVIFFHSHGCVPPSQNDLYFHVMLMDAAMDENEWCFQRICNGFLRILETKVKNITFRVIEYDILAAVKGNMSYECFDYQVPHIGHLMVDNQTKEFMNKYYPSCYPYSLVLWTGSPDVHILKDFWALLPKSCKAGEISKVIIAGIIMLFGVVGNMLVIVVMLNGKHKKEGSSMLRTSLAFADLAMAGFVIAPSFFDHIMLITGNWYSDLRQDPMQDLDHVMANIINQTSSVQESETASYSHTQYRIVQAITFNACIIVSLLTLFVLSIERYIITTKSLKYRHYVSNCRVKFTILTIWSLALIDGVLSAYNRGEFSSLYLAMHRLPINQAFSRPWMVQIYISTRFFILHIIGACTILLSILSIKNFLQEKTRTAKEWSALNMRVSGPYKKENSRILTSLLILSLLFIISVVPFFLMITFKAVNDFLYSWPLVEYVFTWLILAPSAWNPLIYNTRSYQFKSDLRSLIYCKRPSEQ